MHFDEVFVDEKTLRHVMISLMHFDEVYVDEKTLRYVMISL